MKGEAAQIVASHLAFTGVETHAQLDTEGSGGVDDHLATTDGSSRTIEGSDEAVSRRVDLPTSEDPKLFADNLIVAIQQGPPPLITQRGCTFGRSYNIGEELGHFVEDQVLLAEDQHVVSRQRDELGSLNVLSHITPMSHGQEAWIVGAQDQRGRPEEREHRANIEVPKQVVVLCGRGSRGDRRPEEPSQSIAANWVIRAGCPSKREKLRRAPVGPEELDDEIERLRSETDRIVVGDQISGTGIAQHQGIDPFGMCSGIEDRDRASIDRGENGCLLGPDRVEDAFDVFRPLLPCWYGVTRHTVRCPRASSIEKDQAS